MVYEPLYHALSMRLLKIKKQAEHRLFYKLSWEEFLIFCGLFNKTVISLELVGYEMIIATHIQHALVE